MNFKTSNSASFPVSNWFITVPIFLGALLLLILNLGGCSSSTDPQGDTDTQISIEFSPPSEGQVLRLSETMDFAAFTDPSARLTATWYLDGLVVSQDTAFTYTPATVGRHLLEVGAFSGSIRDTFHWYVEVQPDISLLPPEVVGVEVQAGPNPVEVQVSWSRSPVTHFPLVKYLVAFSYSGPITEENWEQATILGEYDFDPDAVRYNRLYNEDDDGMRPGERAWFAVRVRDDHQQLSPLIESPWHDITWAWYLGGLVTDDAGLPLPVVEVTTGDVWDNTDGRGLYQFAEPFRSIDSIRVATTSSSWFNFTTPPIVAVEETTQVDITLINRYDLENPSCWTGLFLEYLRDMTRTVHVPGQPAESQLFTWSEYPVSVYIPAGQLNQAGIDMEAACLAAMDFWNNTMSDDAQVLGIEESPYFERTTNQAAAAIVFLFEFRSQNYGEATLELPVDEQMGEVIPEKMQIWINSTAALDEFGLVQGVALHEFCHTLGLFNHADCPGPEYLMHVGGGTGAMRRAEPIHLDERRAVRAIRNIPQGTDMSDFTDGTGGVFGLTDR